MLDWNALLGRSLVGGFSGALRLLRGSVVRADDERVKMLMNKALAEDRMSEYDALTELERNRRKDMTDETF